MTLTPVPPSFCLDGKSALVTGAGRGIGAAAAAIFAVIDAVVLGLTTCSGRWCTTTEMEVHFLVSRAIKMLG